MAHTHVVHTLTHSLLSTAQTCYQRSKYSRCGKLLGIVSIVIIRGGSFWKSIETAWNIFMQFFYSPTVEPHQCLVALQRAVLLCTLEEFNSKFWDCDNIDLWHILYNLQFPMNKWWCSKHVYMSALSCLHLQDLQAFHFKFSVDLLDCRASFRHLMASIFF